MMYYIMMCLMIYYYSESPQNSTTKILLNTFGITCTNKTLKTGSLKVEHITTEKSMFFTYFLRKKNISFHVYNQFIINN